MTTEFFIEVAKMKPGIAFFRDDAFADDNLKRKDFEYEKERVQ